MVQAPASGSRFDPGDGQQLDVRREEIIFFRLDFRVVRAQVLLVIVHENRDDRGFFGFFVAQSVEEFHRAEEVPAGGDPNAQPQIAGKLLRHEDRVAVIDFDHTVQLVELQNGRDELVRNPLDFYKYKSNNITF